MGGVSAVKTGGKRAKRLLQNRSCSFKPFCKGAVKTVRSKITTETAWQLSENSPIWNLIKIDSSLLQVFEAYKQTNGWKDFNRRSPGLRIRLKHYKRHIYTGILAVKQVKGLKAKVSVWCKNERVHSVLFQKS
jgi:hypothetical protein